MRKSTTLPAPLDHLTTRPALLTQPGTLSADTLPEATKPIYRWIFVAALLALVVAAIVLR